MSWISYAQNYEDVTLMRALRHLPQGFYIDVGAHDPTADSVTRAFYERGWCGINIEPIPAWFERLQSERLRDINLPVAAGSALGELSLYEVEGTGLSTSDAAQAQAYADEGLNVNKRQVPQRTLDDICAEHAAAREIHFLKIDVEGAEREVLQGLDLSRHRPWVILIEATKPRSTESTHAAWEPLLLQRGYQFVWFDGLNRFYVADERASLRSLLAQPPSVQDDFMRYTERFLRDDVADYAELLKIERRRVAQLEGRREDPAEATESTSGAHPQPSAPDEPNPEPGTDSAPNPAFTPQPKPRLALVTPWPPEASGIADSACILVPALQVHFEVEVITPAAADEPDQGPIPLRTPAWFEAHANRYDHICHHLGNSLFHEAVLDLLPRHGGTVVVHDFLISDCLWYLQRTARRPHAWVQALYRSHGWRAIHDIQVHGIEAAVRRWPASLDLLRQADGLIFTSEFSRRWWLRESAVSPLDPGLAATPSVVVPLPCADADDPETHRSMDQASARIRLGLPPAAFVVASFGAIDRSKGHQHLADVWPELSAHWRAQGLDPHLVCVGHAADARLATHLADQGARCTGHAAAQDYEAWIQAADIAVQLRQDSRGESSGALLQCMAAGLPCIVSRHGPMADLPTSAVLHLNNGPGLTQALLSALLALQLDPERRQQLGRSAQLHARSHHAVRRVAREQAQAIHHFSRRSRRGRLHRLIDLQRRIAPEGGDTRLSPATELELRSNRALESCAIDPPNGPPTLWLDVTAIGQHDLGTGIQRVTRNMLRLMLQHGVEGFRVEPVVLNHGRYWTCRRFTATFLQVRPEIVEGIPVDEPACVAAGDTWFGLDLVTDGVHQHEALFRHWRAIGVRIAFLVHDLLPLTHPQWFPDEAVRHFTGWWRTVSRVADVLACNSESTAQAVRAAWAQSPVGPDARPPIVAAFGLGSDLDPLAPSKEPYPSVAGLPEGGVLVVGTIEPRKGVDEVLQAMEGRWAQGASEPLVLVGRPGWNVSDLLKRLNTHPERGLRLHWLQDADDASLHHLYRCSRVLVMASRAEGFGLPIVEALRCGLPVLARDLPVFREIAGEAARYWTDVTGLSAALQAHGPSEVLTSSEGLAPDRHEVLKTWRDSVEALLPLISGPGARLLGDNTLGDDG